jgi:hypothetical protein
MIVTLVHVPCLQVIHYVLINPYSVSLFFFKKKEEIGKKGEKKNRKKKE